MSGDDLSARAPVHGKGEIGTGVGDTAARDAAEEEAEAVEEAAQQNEATKEAP